ncbi:MAG: hypothetical protein C0437_22270 [Ralstonia sp.]|nr:hypothetical protein [Ralstonia sp.]
MHPFNRTIHGLFVAVGEDSGAPLVIGVMHRVAGTEEEATGAATTWHICWQAAVGREFFPRDSLHARIDALLAASQGRDFWLHIVDRQEDRLIESTQAWNKVALAPDSH